MSSEIKQIIQVIGYTCLADLCKFGTFTIVVIL